MTREEADAALDEAVATMRVALGNPTTPEWLTATTLAVQQALLVVAEMGPRLCGDRSVSGNYACERPVGHGGDHRFTRKPKPEPSFDD